VSVAGPDCRGESYDGRHASRRSSCTRPAAGWHRRRGWQQAPPRPAARAGERLRCRACSRSSVSRPRLMSR
jgi:hypothetical protein